MSYRPDPMSTPSGPRTDESLLDGRYELIEEIGEGGAAKVYRAWDHEKSEWRAVKMLMPEFTKRSTLRDRFHREGRTMKSLLDHPNICRVYDTGSDADRAWLVMEYAEGGSVIHWVERHGPMPPRMATQVAIQLCAAIAYAHNHAVIHRDVKPHNLLVDRNGRCKVTDFGIAQIINETRVTMTGTVMGTLGYIAPEQHESAKHADQRADVYSIAATIYTLVHGEAANHLFMAEEQDYEGIPEPLAQVIRKGAQYRREARFQSVAEMQHAFEAIFDRLPPVPSGTPPLVEPGLVAEGPHAGVGRPAQARPQPPARVDDASLDPLPRSRPPQDRTPSSIIPRTSLTSGNRARRPRVRNRDEIERHKRLRTAVLGVGALMAAAFFLMAAIATHGAMQLERHRTLADEGARLLEEELWMDMRLLDLPNLEDREELEGLFDRAQEGWGEKSPDERISDATRILDNIHARVLDISNRSHEDVLRSLYEELKQTEKRLTDDITLYRIRSDQLDEYRSSALGWMGSMIPLSGG